MGYECGPGKEVDGVIPILVEWLNPLLEKYEIRKILDLGCGDLFWASQLEFDGEYVGYDEVIRESAKARAEERKWGIREDDIFSCELDFSDLVIIKDVLIHYGSDECLRLLAKAKRSGKYLCAESHYMHDWPRDTKHHKTEDGKVYACKANKTNLREILGEPIEEVEIGSAGVCCQD